MSKTTKIASYTNSIARASATLSSVLLVTNVMAFSEKPDFFATYEDEADVMPKNDGLISFLQANEGDPTEELSTESEREPHELHYNCPVKFEKDVGSSSEHASKTFQYNQIENEDLEFELPSELLDGTLCLADPNLAEIDFKPARNGTLELTIVSDDPLCI